LAKYENQILQGDALTKLKELESESVDCIITSPPYWALRDYKVDGQIGVEKTIDEYVNNLITVFDECKRVLKKSGTCWIVLGDTYFTTTWTGHFCKGRTHFKSDAQAYNQPYTDSEKPTANQVPQKSLCMIPERFAIKMIDKGWILRNKIIWWKPNCMPSSAKDRFTVDYEYVYFFTKSQKYYFKTQYEPYISTDGRPFQERVKHETWGGNKKAIAMKSINPTYLWKKKEFNANPLGRIKRCVWSIPTKPFPEAHFAVFPEQLVQQCLDAGCSTEICKKCNTAKIIDYCRPKSPNVEVRQKRFNRDSSRKIGQKYQKWLQENPPIEQINSCDCNTGFESGIVLDPFMGSGTVALVALKNDRKFIGIELNSEYIKIANKRIEPYLLQSKLI
jgi:site-specific DNA-methyltransferase (adenine-specific)